MSRRIWIVFVLILCVFFVFFFAPFGEEAEQVTNQKTQEAYLSEKQVFTGS